MADEITVVDGKIDSVTLLVYLQKIDRKQRAVIFNLGDDRRNKGMFYAQEVCRDFKIDYDLFDLHFYSKIFSDSQFAVPEVGYLILPIAYSVAVIGEESRVNYGSHKCNSRFIAAINSACQIANASLIDIVAPFNKLKLSELIKIGTDLGVDYRKTWSCELSGDYHCGNCEQCFDRRQAFVQAGITDPTTYE